MKPQILHLGTAYIEQNLFLDLTLEECARAAGYSLYHYCRVFNAAMGITVKEYIRRRRVSEAAKMINETSLPLKEIAYRCGFNSQENFIRVFRSAFGITPNDYKTTKYTLHLLEAGSLPATSFREPDYSAFAEPKIILLNAFKVAGRKHLTSFDKDQHFQDVPVFWNRFYAEQTYKKLGCLPDQPRTDHGVSLFEDFSTDLYDDNNRRKGLDFHYLTGVRVSEAKKIPESLDTVTIPAGLYAAFRPLPADDYNLIQNLIDTWRYIDYHWLPASRYEHSGSHEFNEYNPHQNRLSKTIYIPIKRKHDTEEQNP